MLLGYNTNGLAHHSLADGLRLIADRGFRSVAITLDHAALNPYAVDAAERIADCRTLLTKLGLRSVIETGARFLLESRCKHEPTLMTPDGALRRRRVEFLMRAIDVAASLGSDCVSLWSGVLRDGAEDAVAWRRLLDGLREVLAHAANQQVAIGFEPEPGMFIDTMDKFRQLDEQIEDANFQLTLDVGHLHCLGETPVADHIREWGPRIVNVHIEDMRAGVHEHLMFGEGEMDFPPILHALNEVGYRRGLHVELSRHSHDAVNAVRRSAEFLQALLPDTSANREF